MKESASATEKYKAQKEAATENSAPPPVTWVLLIRHGENEWVSTGKLAGRTPGVLLNERGREQAEQVAEFLADQPIEAVYSSPLDRCIETAEPLARQLGLTTIVEDALIEADYGEWQGLELKGLADTPEWSMVQHFPSVFRFPGGETLRQAQQRAVDGIERIVAQHPDGVIALFSHADVIRTVVAHYGGIPLDLFQRLQISTASVTTLAFFGGRPALVNMNLQPSFERIKRRRDLPQQPDTREAPSADVEGEAAALEVAQETDAAP